MNLVSNHTPLSVVTSRLSSGIVQVKFVGEIDLASAELVRATLRRLLDEPERPGGVLVDLSDVSFLDAVGIGELVRARRSAAAAGISLELHSPRGVVSRVLSVPAIARDLPVVPAQARGGARDGPPDDPHGEPWTPRTALF